MYSKALVTVASFVIAWLLSASMPAFADDLEDSEKNPYHPATENDFRSLELKAMSQGFALVDPAEEQKEVLVEYKGDKLQAEVDRVFIAYKKSLLPAVKTVTVFEQSTLCSSPAIEEEPLFFSVGGFVAIDTSLDYLYYGRRVIDPLKYEEIANDLTEYFQGTTYRLPLDGAVALLGDKGRGTTFVGEEFPANRFNLENDLNYHPLDTILFCSPLRSAFHGYGGEEGPNWILEKKFDSLVKYQDGSVRMQFRLENSPGTVGEIWFTGDPLLPKKYSLYLETGFERFGREWKSKAVTYNMWAEWEQDYAKQWYIRTAQTKQFKRSSDPKRARRFLCMLDTKRLSPKDPQFDQFFDIEDFGNDVPPIEVGNQK